METNGQQVYGFWDGDFTFHHAEYDDPSFNYTFRVRIDNEDAEERAQQNTSNLNRAPGDWKNLRPATQAEIDVWLGFFNRSYPLRPTSVTEGLRHLALHGATPSEALPVAQVAALLSLTFPRTIIRDFRPEQLTLVTLADDVFSLTDAGRWLVALMK